MRCRSDCDAVTTQRVVAVSQSGRVWESQVCDSEDHLDGTLGMVRDLGFTVKAIDELEPLEAGS